jgi:hypothetical protein
MLNFGFPDLPDYFSEYPGKVTSNGQRPLRSWHQLIVGVDLCVSFNTVEIYSVINLIDQSRMDVLVDGRT